MTHSPYVWEDADIAVALRHAGDRQSRLMHPHQLVREGLPCQREPLSFSKSRITTRSLLAPAVLTIAMVTTFTMMLRAQEVSVESKPAHTAESPVCILTSEDRDAFRYIPGDAASESLSKTSANIVISFMNESPEDPWPQEAMDALNYAAGIWSNIVTSQVAIRIEASWTDLGDCDGSQFALASAGPQFVWRNFRNAPLSNTWYPDAVADAINGADLGGGKTDILAKFNRSCGPSGSGRWYSGTDGKPPSGTIDMASVALHEFAHGLGLFGNANVDDGQSSNGAECDGTEGLGCIGGGKANDQLAYDQFTEDGNGVSLLALSNPSVVLATALQGGRAGGIFFSGQKLADAGFDRARLYAPATFRPGASYAHPDENTYNRTPEALMTPFLARAESIHVPGDLTCGILADVGWTLSGPCTSIATSAQDPETISDQMDVSGPYPNPFSDQATIQVLVFSDQSVTIDVFDTLGRLVRRVYSGILSAGTTQQFEIAGSDLSAGAYILTVTGISGTTTRTLVVTK